MTAKYCERCGSPLIEERTNRFNPETGENIKRMVCSQQPCAHNGHNTINLEPTGLFALFRADTQCVRCGVKWKSD